jgi:hypothetical protein
MTIMKKDDTKKSDLSNSSQKDAGSNNDRQAVDKAPGEERGKQENVTQKDLKGKKVDGDPSQENDRPVE